MIDPSTLINLKQAVPFFMVTDMNRSLEFYEKGLRFERKFEWKQDGRIEWCWVQRESVALMLQQYRKDLVPKEKLGVGVSVCVVCQDALALYNEFKRNGLKPAEPFVGNTMWVVALTDPDGYRVDFESSTDVPEETRYSAWMARKV